MKRLGILLCIVLLLAPWGFNQVDLASLQVNDLVPFTISMSQNTGDSLSATILPTDSNITIVADLRNQHVDLGDLVEVAKEETKIRYGFKPMAIALILSGNNSIVENKGLSDDIQYISGNNIHHSIFRNVTLGSQVHDFAISISNSINVTFSDIIVRDYNASNTDFVAISLQSVTDISMTSITLERLQGSGTVTGIKIDGGKNIDVTSFNYDGDEANFVATGNVVGFNITSASNVTVSSSSVQDTAGAGVTAFSLSNIVNGTFDVDVTNIKSSSSRIYGIQANNVSNINFNSFSLSSVYSLKDTLDFGDARSTYGIYVKTGTNVTIQSPFFNSVNMAYNVYPIFLEDLTGPSIGSINIIGIVAADLKIVHASNIHNLDITGLSASALTSSEFSGIELLDSSGSVNITNVGIADVTVTSLASGISIVRSHGVSIRNLSLQNFGSSSVAFDLFGVYSVKSNGLVLNGTAISSLSSNVVNAFGAYFSQSNSTIVTGMTFADISSKAGSAVGIYTEYSQDNWYVENQFSNIALSSSTPSLSPKSISADDAYAMYLIQAANQTIQANSFTSINNWLVYDETSQVSLVNNSIDSILSSLVSFSRPSDITYDIGQPFPPIIWNAATSPANQSGNYSIFVNDVLEVTDDWISGQNITFSLSNVTLGTYVVKLVLTEMNGLNTTDIVIVDVIETTLPIFLKKEQNQTVAKDALATLEWIANDTNPDTYSILRNGTEVQFGTWTPNQPVEFHLNGTPVGIWNFTVIFRDTGNNHASQSVMVTILVPRPLNIVSADRDISFTKGELAYLKFMVDGSQGGSFSLSIDGIPSLVGSWSPNVTVSINLTDFAIGEYELVFVVSDTFKQTETFTSSVLVRSPSITPSGGFDLTSRIGDVLDEPAFTDNLPTFLAILAAFVGTGLVIRYRRKHGRLPWPKFLTLGNIRKNKKSSKKKKKPKKKKK